MLPETPTLPHPGASAPATAVTGTTVYIVDDEISIRTALLRLLHSIHCTPTAFASAREFLDFRSAALAASAARHEPPAMECLVLDVHMPEMNGLALQEELRRRNDSIPIIFITGQVNMQITAQAMQQGAVAFLHKPFDQQELLHAIETTLAAYP